MQNNKIAKEIKTVFEDSVKAKQNLLADDTAFEVLADMAHIMADAFERGNKVLFCGNGGSAADAQHLAAEFLVRLRASVERDGLPALTLATDTSAITAYCNDYDFNGHYARMVQALGQKGDVLVGLSTSGNSANILLAFEQAKKQGIATLGFLGRDGGTCKAACDTAFIVPELATERIQECHITAGHALVQCTEDILLKRGFI